MFGMEHFGERFAAFNLGLVSSLLIHTGAHMMDQKDSMIGAPLFAFGVLMAVLGMYCSLERAGTPILFISLGLFVSARVLAPGRHQFKEAVTPEGLGLSY